MSIIKSFLKLNKALHRDKVKVERARSRVADYSAVMLNKLFIFFSIIIIVLIPVVRYLVAAYEGREITYGQAAVFIIQTITTTGYGELLPFRSYPMMILSILLMISGVIIIFMFAGTLMATFVEKRVAPRAPSFTKLKGHVIFTDYNDIVARTIKLLEKNNVPYVVASKEKQKSIELIEKGVNCIHANPSYDEGLKRLGVKDAQLVVASSDDTENINIILGVSTTSSTPVLAIMENGKRAELAHNAGAKYVVAIEETLGNQLIDWICADASSTEFLKLIDVDVSPHLINKLKPSIIHIGAHSSLKGKSISELKIRTLTGATVAAIWHTDGSITTPSAETKIDESTLIVLGPHDNVDRFASFVGGPGPGEHVVLVGVGRVGQQAGKRLNRSGISPYVIDVSRRHLDFDGKLIIGDATMPQVLKEAKIEEADTLIVTLNNDNYNIFTVLASTQLNPGLNIVARAVHVDTIDRLRQAGANHVLAESILGAQLLQTAMVETGALPKFSNYFIREVNWHNGLMNIRELAMKYRLNVKIICVVRAEEILEATAELMLQKNDRIVALGSPDTIEYLRVVAGEHK